MSLEQQAINLNYVFETEQILVREEFHYVIDKSMRAFRIVLWSCLRLPL